MRPPVIVKSGLDIAAVLRGDRETLGLTGEAMDERIGWADRYTAKCENPDEKWGKKLFRIEPMAEFWLAGLNRTLLIMDTDQAEALVRSHSVSSPGRGLQRVSVQRLVFG